MLKITQELLEKHPMRENETEREYRRRLVRSRSVNKYNKYNTKQVSIRLNYNTDSDVISWLENISETRSSYIKRLIREDMSKTEQLYDDMLNKQKAKQILEDQAFEQGE
jgi:predicted DNA-binding protein